MQMGPSCVAEQTLVVCLGNDLIADDALGPEVAERLRHRGVGARVLEPSEAGLGLLDEIVGTKRLVVVDTVVTGGAPPGTVHVVPGDDLPAVPVGAPHAVGLFEALQLGRALGLAVPPQVTVVAVEAGDLTGIGSPMTPPVRAAVDRVVDLVIGLVGGSAQQGPAGAPTVKGRGSRGAAKR
jgi:hydrogenase maturation protease